MMLADKTNATTPALTVYYDGACPLCTAEINLYRRSRGAQAIAFVNVAHGGGSATSDLGGGLTCAVAMRRFHVRGGDGQLYSGAAAFARLWRELPRWRWLGRFMGMRLVLPLGEAAYRAFLPIRPYIARVWRRSPERV